MAAAFGWQTLAVSSLVIGAVVALLLRISLRVIGLIASARCADQRGRV